MSGFVARAKARALATRPRFSDFLELLPHSDQGQDLKNSEDERPLYRNRSDKLSIRRVIARSHAVLAVRLGEQIRQARRSRDQACHAHSYPSQQREACKVAALVDEDGDTHVLPLQERGERTSLATPRISVLRKNWTALARTSFRSTRRSVGRTVPSQ